MSSSVLSGQVCPRPLYPLVVCPFLFCVVLSQPDPVLYCPPSVLSCCGHLIQLAKHYPVLDSPCPALFSPIPLNSLLS